MDKFNVALLAAALLGGPGALNAAVAAEFGPANPFYAPSKLPFQAPRFDQIKDEDYQPAIEAGMVQQKSEIVAIAESPSAPTFDNTLLPLERSGLLLARASAAFEAVTGANTDAALQAAKTSLAPKLAAHHDAIYLNDKLFARISAIYHQRAAHPMDAESLRLITVTYDEFVRSGATLAAPQKIRLQKLNEEASTLSNTFTTKLLAGTMQAAFNSRNPESLAGLSPAQLAAAAQTAQSRQQPGYVLTLQNTTQQPAFVVLRDRATRHAIFDNSWNRTERGDANDTRGIVTRLAQLRAERAKLLGYASHAAWQLSDQMAKSPDAAIQFMDSLVPFANAKAAREAADIQAVIDAQPAAFKLEAWDWEFYGDQVRKAKYDLDDSQIRPYFELNNVLINGVFYAATQLYGITFKERADIPTYQADVRVFEVDDVDQKPLALFYCDYFKRDNKNGGAWMSSFVSQSQLLGTQPVIYNVANLPKPAAGEPALISFSDVTTLFHEFGHALHGMFANTRYPSLSGTATARDFVEFPSQFNEHWALYPAVFEHFARHYQTGAPMPTELQDKIKQSENLTEGYGLSELLAAAELDMQWHMLAADAPPQDPDAFEKKALTRAHLDNHAIPPRYRSTYFSHIWSGDYSAGYYAYLWTEMLDDDAYLWFTEHGGLTRANGDRFRQMILSKGNTQDLATLYADWRGRPPSIDALMKYRGLKPAAP